MHKALVAHDLQIPRGAIQHALRMFGFECDTVVDYDALDILLRKMTPTLLVVDIDFPPSGAAQAIRAVRGFNSGDIKIIGVLKRDDFDFEHATILSVAGANEVIIGGYDAKKLETKLRVLGLIPP